MSALSLTELSVSYGAITAVHGLSLDLEDGEFVAVLGPNGAGKTSTLAGIMRLIAAKGSVRLGDTDISSWSTERIVHAGMTLVPEGRRIFAGLTVAENLRLGKAAGKTHEWESQIDQLFPILRDRSSQAAGTLSGGEQQQLAMARALLSDPTVLLLDEPSLGLAPSVVDRIFELVTALRSRGLSVILVEQDVERSLEVCDRAIVLASGEVVANGTPAELRKAGVLQEAYFGSSKESI
ncbi:MULTISPECIES: ABC transporter ATP-binding protein [unclassified Mycolicibacterium]|uniref:ABC transporter ATP-binding protein n=1 Tax=unclassified Mycolicibacterium TaxID=2636767 RepID=UPI0012DC6AE4|nr:MULTISPECIES: ABC transporter ATP-binding protein [unclassified Mycolicibacterium]MUL84745.1 ABC transporter ATP-binding protein [Mycolicibacterium sp. CBMA 329]MUL88520.1 ABC transporter ATP-binding protein [Mycolicibacterium sp. CBMA 331]MUM00141.1 ABC transporter ATP-binding protein [Mycolicibacterium sp. CBMA 334]MUM27805.1 ABC transporter ATP-binding protein [Mycolicibacterium sp. CBMA 295]MUM40167.1 ABC transporter ATP-binding protein [Mycolicibacterium sp. CBMA 247]